MVATDDDRRADLAFSDKFVEKQTGLVALTEPEPADSRRKPLKAEPRLAPIKVAREESFWVGVA